MSSSEAASSRRYFKVSRLAARWGGVSRMFVERKIKSDPDFPTIYRIGTKGRTRLVDEVELEQYERRSVGRKAATA